ncbi:MAG: ABC transporter substrate-binding protein [Candidatus Dormibacteraeota bacterium]|uniref:ABC transporter substrate-binding protein n=3 Tax=Candidatus Dormibacteria TaxID=3126996 RepID=A0A934N7R3_9BACT|nr:ABC transporter substrate-binding protein [Candidatus Dormibacteraeota bacterium]MBJ7607171.1 ABC transporter substrate-binding protein [Candidatus Dormibacteraeota bacterium]
MSTRLTGWNRRWWIALAMAALAVVACGGGGGAGTGSTKDVKIALVVPLSGPYAEHGKLMQDAAELARDDINSQGGIKALNGSKVQLVIQDAGGTVESVTSATQRVLQGGDITAADGCWLSSFTLAATEIAERQKVPWLTFSFADQITGRGYKHVFRLDAPAAKQIPAALDALTVAAKASNHTITTAALAGDNTASSVSYFENLRQKLPGAGVKIVLDKVWTPPLADPTQLALQVKNANPDIIFGSPTTFADTVGLQRALYSVGERKPVMGNGGQFLTPEVGKSLGNATEGLAAVAGSAVMKGMENLSKRFEDRFHTFMIQDSSSVYAEIWTIKEAIEKAKSSDPTKVRDALASIDITSGPAAQIPGGEVKFDANGDNVRASVAIVQWQNGRPVTVAPVNQAIGHLKWPS